jgi:hypothetical protein
VAGLGSVSVSGLPTSPDHPWNRTAMGSPDRRRPRPLMPRRRPPPPGGSKV